MSSNVDYVVCPECHSLNAAQWNPRGRRSYDVTCSVCGFEHEHGHYESARNLTFEQFVSESMEAQRIDDPDYVDEGRIGVPREHGDDFEGYPGHQYW